jgi:hypothetical protein
VPVINVAAFLNDDGEESLIECQKVAESLHKYGVLIFKDPRAQEHENEEYIDLMEQYFDKVSKDYYSGNYLPDAKPEFHY